MSEKNTGEKDREEKSTGGKVHDVFREHNKDALLLQTAKELINRQTNGICNSQAIHASLWTQCLKELVELVEKRTKQLDHFVKDNNALIGIIDELRLEISNLKNKD